VATKTKQPPKPVLQIRFTYEGRVFEAEVPGGIAAMKGGK
jgi:hypothetical protein